MITIKKKHIAFLAMTTGLLLTGISCSDSFFDQKPPGAYTEPSLANEKGVNGMLIAAYSMLDGSYFESWDNNYFNQVGGGSNWVWGSIRGGDAYKGTEPTDFVDINAVETHSVNFSNGTLNTKWTAVYDGIARANQALRGLAVATDISDENRLRIEGEARFLRAHYHFEALKAFGVAPWVPETALDPDLRVIQNDHMIWDEIEADFLFGYTNLPSVQIAAGRANKWAAGAYLAKVKIFQAEWAEALTILNDVLANGKTAAGATYNLLPKYGDLYRVASENGSVESVFAYQASAGDGTIGNGNYENTLNQPHGSSAPTGCCGFFQPSQNFVNSFKVDGSGLPLFATYNNTDLKNDEGILSSDASYTPDTTTPLDPRLDWSVGRRGIPFLDWGIHPGSNYIRLTSYGGPYSPVKNVPSLAELNGSEAGVIDWGFTSSAQNVGIIRYADVLLWAAECEAEVGSLANATTLVNRIRTRAANAAGFVQGSPANYQIGTYSTFATRADALRAIRFERKLELGMEGHRFFDLVRWDNATDAGKTALAFDIVDYINNEYLAEEKTKRNHLSTATFTEKYKYLPIPENVITQMTVGGQKLVDQSTAWGGTRTLN
ncbi:MAG: RagB/SusD family nutrient uptake outer membrane protein [Cyclobacteriaceae bacterium]|nr:RagB/SusD family nutrient uptake outer membrane protein [Cyclobacteriaceae bacterium]